MASKSAMRQSTGRRRLIVKMINNEGKYSAQRADDDQETEILSSSDEKSPEALSHYKPMGNKGMKNDFKHLAVQPDEDQYSESSSGWKMEVNGMSGGQDTHEYQQNMPVDYSEVSRVKKTFLAHQSVDRRHPDFLRLALPEDEGLNHPAHTPAKIAPSQQAIINNNPKLQALGEFARNNPGLPAANRRVNVSHNQLPTAGRNTGKSQRSNNSYLADQGAALPFTYTTHPFGALNNFVASSTMEDIDDINRAYFMGINMGIGLGQGAAKAYVLNHLENTGTFFDRQVAFDNVADTGASMRHKIETEDWNDIEVATLATNTFLFATQEVAAEEEGLAAPTSSPAPAAQAQQPSSFQSPASMAFTPRTNAFTSNMPQSQQTPAKKQTFVSAFNRPGPNAMPQFGMAPPDLPTGMAATLVNPDTGHGGFVAQSGMFVNSAGRAKQGVARAGTIATPIDLTANAANTFSPTPSTGIRNNASGTKSRRRLSAGRVGQNTDGGATRKRGRPRASISGPQYSGFDGYDSEDNFEEQDDKNDETYEE